MSSIYGVLDYDPSKTDYVKDDIVKCGPCSSTAGASGRFYYNLGNSVSDNTNVSRPEGTDGVSFWGGYLYVPQIEDERPLFIWLPDYNIQMASSPRVHTIQFGDGYEQRIVDGINNDLIQITLTFGNRKEAETMAISHFLSTRAARESFYFRVPEPHNVYKKFVSAEWSSTLNFEDNFTTTASFKEVA